MANLWAPPAAMVALAVITSYRRGEEIYSQGHPAEYWYWLLSGVAKKCVVMTDGRRQIVSFLLPNDFFGFTTAKKHTSGVVAVVDDTVVAGYPRVRVESLADSDPRIGQYIRERTFEAVSHSQARSLILGRPTILEQVRSFVIEVKQHMIDGGGNVRFPPLSSYEIADCLSLTVAEVSSALTTLKDDHEMTLASRCQVTIIDRDTFDQ